MISLWPKKTFDDKIQFTVVWVLRLSLVAAAFWSVLVPSFDLMVSSLLALLFSFAPLFIGNHYKVRLPIEFELLAVIFIYASLFIGFAFDAYARIWWWDDLLHTSSGVVFGFAGFVILYTLQYQRKLQAYPGFIAFLIIAFSSIFGVLWEVFEFIADTFFGGMMQPSLQDTMLDLIVDILGSLVIAVPAYFYLKHGSEGFLAQMLKNYVKGNPHFRPKLPGRKKLKL